MTYQVVWFKRDLRIVDHAALYHAAAQGPVLCLYIIEPSLWQGEDVANQHYQFILESLRELNVELMRHGGCLSVVTGEVTDVLSRLFASRPFRALYAHEETGNALSYQRDLAVARWCHAHRVGWHEYAQFAVVRGLKSRDTRYACWQAHVAVPCWPVPSLIFAALPWHEPEAPLPATLGLFRHDPAQRQRGGREHGLAVLSSFLAERSSRYRGGISSPLSAPGACSRLSPYLAYGCISLREVVQSSSAKLASLAGQSGPQAVGLSAFISRLHWHCHFIQKLESEPELEFRNMHRAYDGLREADWNQAHFVALINGRTGWPMVDASVAMLRETGWINFRMRAMLVSVATCPLWLHWQPVGLWLARQFLDYEPGIHWSQMQMQAGTTGINTLRIYNPVKQAHDHDPHGHFVRRWLPAMRRVPDSWLFEPWRMPAEMQRRCGLRVGLDIPVPLVDIEQATREAKAKLFALRARPEVKVAKAAIVLRHASRRPAMLGTSARKSKVVAAQLGLEF